jgi:predicted Zn-dependent protease
MWPHSDIEDGIVSALDNAVLRSAGDGLQLVLDAVRDRVLRLADGEIHQSVDRQTLRLVVSAVEGERIGVVSTGVLVPAEIEAAVERARVNARLMPPDPHFAGLPSTGEGPGGEADAYDEATATAAPEDLSRLVATCIDAAREEGTQPSGALRIRERLLLARNTLGIGTRSASTEADLSLTCFAGWEGRRASGYANRFSRRISDLDPWAVTREAAGKAKLGRTVRVLGAGSLPALLEPTAVADLVGLMAWAGFDATAVREERSFISGRIGEKILDEKLHLRDDPSHPRTAAPMIDFEGVPRRPLRLIEAGVPLETATSHRSARREGVASNGRSADPMTGWSETVLEHLVVAPGRDRREDLIRSIKKGVLVSRLWYARTLQPREGTVTALSRDGVLAIEDGEITGGAGNFRTNASLLELFGRIAGIGEASVPTHGVVAPAILVEALPLSSPSA